MPGSSEQREIHSGRAGEGATGKRPRTDERPAGKRPRTSAGKRPRTLQTLNHNNLGQGGGGGDDQNGGTPASRSEGAGPGPGSSGAAQLNEAPPEEGAAPAASESAAVAAAEAAAAEAAAAEAEAAAAAAEAEALLLAEALLDLERLMIILSGQQVETTGERLQRAGWNVGIDKKRERWFWWTRAQVQDGPNSGKVCEAVKGSPDFRSPRGKEGTSVRYLKGRGARGGPSRELVYLVLTSLGWKLHDRWEHWLGETFQGATETEEEREWCSQGEREWYLAWAERYVLEAAEKEKEVAATGDPLRAEDLRYRPTTDGRKDRNVFLSGQCPKLSAEELRWGLSAKGWGNTKMFKVLAGEAQAVGKQQLWARGLFLNGGADLGSQGDGGVRQVCEHSDRWSRPAENSRAILAGEEGQGYLHERVFAAILDIGLRDGTATGFEKFFLEKVTAAAGRPLEAKFEVRVTANERNPGYRHDVEFLFGGTDAMEAKVLKAELKALKRPTVNLHALLKSAIPGEDRIYLATSTGYNAQAQVASSAVPFSDGSQAMTWVPPARLEEARQSKEKALHVPLPPPSEKQVALGHLLVRAYRFFEGLRKYPGANKMAQELHGCMEALSDAILRDGLNDLQKKKRIEWVEVPGPLFYLQQPEYRETILTWLAEKEHRWNTATQLRQELKTCAEVTGALGRSDLDKAVRNYQEKWRVEGLNLLWLYTRCAVDLDERSRSVQQQNSV